MYMSLCRACLTGQCILHSCAVNFYVYCVLVIQMKNNRIHGMNLNFSPIVHYILK